MTFSTNSRNSNQRCCFDLRGLVPSFQSWLLVDGQSVHARKSVTISDDENTPFSNTRIKLLINFKVFDARWNSSYFAWYFLFYNLVHQKSWNVIMSRKWIGNNLDSLRNIEMEIPILSKIRVFYKLMMILY